MAEFVYLTRENTNPQGKPKVYFTSHPADQKLFLKSIGGEILDNQNCAVYYLAGDVNPKDRAEYEFDLGEMRLFVIPITSRLLKTSNRAMDVDVPFALRNNIPILPIMQEKNLEELFNKKFGDLQFLDATSSDSTAIDYSEKLARYLGAVLVDDDLASEVRAAFDAYIFLSYRKKDRQQANELMRLIHQDPRCRTIAIWYDEFLTPGENFNDAIKEALEKSDLFALAITPNIIKGDNYVMSIEYPLARKLGKSILPVEMVSTWHWNLTRKLKGLPEIVDGKSADTIGSRTLEAVKSIGFAEEGHDPLHSFFIGLAYLTGIDVEVDQAYGVKLISESANAGCLEAMQKLVWMYNAGEGVPRDYGKAIEWQGKLVDALQEAYDADGDRDTADALLSAINTLASFHFLQCRYDEAQTFYNKLLNCVDDMGFDGGDPLLRYRSMAYDGLGRIADAHNDVSEANAFYAKEKQLYESLANTQDDLMALSDLSVCYARIAAHALERGDYETAEENYSKAIAIIEKAISQDGNPAYRRHLYAVLEGYGNMSRALGDYELAEQYYLRGLEVCKKVNAEYESAAAARDAGVFCERLGSIFLEKGDATEARRYFESCLEMREELAAKTNAIDIRSDLSVVYDKLGDIANAQGNANEAEKLYRKSFEVSKKLVDETNTIQARRGLGASYIHLGNCALAKGDKSTAEDYYLKGAELSKSVVEESGYANSGTDLAMSLYNLGILKFSKRDWDAARDYFAQAVEAGEANLERSDDLATKSTIYAICDGAGNASHEIMDLWAAEKYYRRAFEVSESIVEKADTASNNAKMASAIYHVANVGGRKKDYEDAVQVLERVLLAYPNLPDIDDMLDEMKENLRNKR